MTRTYKTPAFVLAAIALLALVSGFANIANANGNPQHVNATVTVTGPHVTLGDLFDDGAHGNNAPAWAEVRVADAPAPGETRRVRIVDVATAARRASLNWDTATAPRFITVTRSGEPVAVEAIEMILSAALPESVGSDMDLRLNNSRFSVYLPSGHSTADITVSRMHFDDRSGSFNATLSIPDGSGDSGAGTRDHTVTGRVVEMVDLPVLSRALSSGDVIRERDLMWTRVAARQVNRNVITRSDEIVGLAARRGLRAETPVRVSDVERPVMVQKGSTVTMTVNTGDMMLTASGRALEHGSEGDVIRIVNLSTHNTVEAAVVSPRMVTVGLNNRVASQR